MFYAAEVRKAAVSRCSELFDHLISAGEQRCGISRPSTLPVLRDFDPDHLRSGLIGLADEHGQADGGNAGNGFHSMSPGRIDLKTASPDW